MKVRSVGLYAQRWPREEEGVLACFFFAVLCLFVWEFIFLMLASNPWLALTPNPPASKGWNLQDIMLHFQVFLQASYCPHTFPLLVAK